VPPEIPSRRLALEPLVDHVVVALDRGKVGACLTDLARGERMFGGRRAFLIVCRFWLAYG
jgi:hypothetical protein